ncbi:glycosyltransferase family 39 protein [Gimesia panareensis]|nr:glycosyltransferase family 39 protein [Gimesia panareensis]
MHFQAARETSLKDVWLASRIHTHPPLVFLFYHFWLNVGDSEVILRLPALIFSGSALFLGYLWLREMVGEKPALVGLVFLTFSMPMVHLGAQMRCYTLLLTFIFAALYFHERFLQRHSLSALIISVACLTLAMLTHYNTAWFLLVLGLLTLLRVFSGTLPGKLVIVWALTQVVLLGVCMALYFGHVRIFINSDTQADLWDFWIRDSDYTVQNTEPWKIPLMRLLEFIKFTAGFMGLLIAACLLPGAIRLGKVAYKHSGSYIIAIERGMLILLPLLLAMLLFQFRIYPLGHTRHSMWLIPFVALGLSASTLFLFQHRGLWKNVALASVLGFWIVNYTVPIIFNFKTTQTPEAAHRFVRLIQDTVPAGEVILTDESTRNVLEYYLAGRQVTHGKQLEGGYSEYQMGKYRVVTIPKFHFFMYQFRKDWDSYLNVFKESAKSPVWVVYLGYEREELKPEHLFPLFPAGELTKQAHYLDNQIMRIRFLSPDFKSVRKANSESDS